MLRGDTVIGVITIRRIQVQPFTERQIELLTTFADQAVIAIENVRLFDEVQKRTRDLTGALDRQTATSEVLQVISKSPGELPAGVRDHDGKCDQAVQRELRRHVAL